MSNSNTTNQDNNLGVPNAQRKVMVSRTDLPLHCPVKGKTLWDSHPRVFIPIEEAENKTAICPYCGTEYLLKD